MTGVQTCALPISGFRRGWNFGELVIGLALPITRVDGRSTGALLTYFSYELPFR